MRTTFREILEPHMHQLNHRPVSTKTRNVAIVDATWFSDFLEWLEGRSDATPGPINNTELSDRIKSGELLVMGSDYEIVESNVMTSIAKQFKGGPVITRPLVPDPMTGAPLVILRPVRFTVTYNMNSIQKTAHPYWAMSEVKKQFCEKFDLDPAKFVLQAGESSTPIEETALCGDVFAKLGSSITLSMRRAPPTSSYERRPIARLSRKTGKTEQVQCDFILPNSLANFFEAFIHCLVHVKPLADVFQGYVSETSQNHLFMYMKAYFTARSKDRRVAYIPHNIYQWFLDEYPRSFETHMPQIGVIIETFLKELDRELSSQCPIIYDLFALMFKQQRQCEKCQQTYECDKAYFSLQLPTNSNIHNSSDLAVRISEAAARKTNDEQICIRCGKLHRCDNQNELIKLPSYFILLVPENRHIFANDVSLRDTLNLSGLVSSGGDEEFALFAVVSHHDGPSEEFKAIAFDEVLDTWISYKDVPFDVGEELRCSRVLIFKKKAQTPE